MAKLLGYESQGHETCCHELEVMGSNPTLVETVCIVHLSKSYMSQKIYKVFTHIVLVGFSVI